MHPVEKRPHTFFGSWDLATLLDTIELYEVLLAMLKCSFCSLAHVQLKVAAV